MTGLIERTLHQLGERLPGRLSLPGDSGYAAATAIWVKPVDRKPRAVVHCRTAEDVQAAIRAARDCDLPLSVRAGGHDWAGRALCDGIVIDLSAMNSVVVGSDNRTARTGGGARFADVVAVTDPRGLAPVAGSVDAVGVGGFTLGGGYGALIGRFGLGLDNLVGAQVVLADGRIVTADADNEPELFWALRGGGGNFGVVTTLVHRLHDLPTVHTGLLIYPFSEAEAILQRCADLMDSMPEELAFQLGFVAGPDGVPVVFIMPTWSGVPAKGEAQVAPFLKLGTLLAGTVETKSYGTSLRAFDGSFANGQRAFMETSWLPTLDGASVDALVEAMETPASPGCAIITHEFRGVASRVPVEATAFPLRRDHVLIEIIATFADRSDALEEQRHDQWARATRQALEAMALPGGYPNLLAPGDTDRAAETYGRNAERLIKAKRHYDPENIFRSAIPLPLGRDDRRRSRSGAFAG
jgi:FAD/FMN-containing dehydrogenase